MKKLLDWLLLLSPNKLPDLLLLFPNIELVWLNNPLPWLLVFPNREFPWLLLLSFFPNRLLPLLLLNKELLWLLLPKSPKVWLLFPKIPVFWLLFPKILLEFVPKILELLKNPLFCVVISLL